MTTDTQTIDLTLDKTRLDVHFIHAFLATQSDWAKGISLERVETSIANSLCVGAYDGARQVGFARLVTDFATFGYLCDVLVDEAYRGLGLGRRLSGTLMEVPEVQSLRRILLTTTTAPWLYEKIGFVPVNRPDYIWQIHRPNVYASANDA